MFNATVIGNLGKDAELKYLADGKPVANFSIASSIKIKGNDETTWVRVALFGKQAETLSGYLIKGKQVAVTGRVRNRQYDSEGTVKYSLELDANDVQLLGGGKSSGDTTTEKASAPTHEVTAADAPF